MNCRKDVPVSEQLELSVAEALVGVMPLAPNPKVSVCYFTSDGWGDTLASSVAEVKWRLRADPKLRVTIQVQTVSMWEVDLDE
jgi:hypothetical protein